MFLTDFKILKRWIENRKLSDYEIDIINAFNYEEKVFVLETDLE